MINLTAIGNLGKDAIVNNVNGKSVINFNVAHTEKYKDHQGAQTQKTVWVQCAYWSDKTGIVPYLKKGTMVYVAGQPEVKEFKKNDGTFGSALNLRVSTIQLLSSSRDNSQGDQSNPEPSTGYQPMSSGPQQAEDITEPLDGLPF